MRGNVSEIPTNQLYENFVQIILLEGNKFASF
jgi:hypothetical protein